MSAAKICRVCAQPLFPEPLLRYWNMPAAAQGFPDPAAGDRSVGVPPAPPNPKERGHLARNQKQMRARGPDPGLGAQLTLSGKPDAIEFSSGRDAHAPFFNPLHDTGVTKHKLPHWSQSDCYCFVTWRLEDALPKAKLDEWNLSRESWLKDHPRPWDEATEADYYELFSSRLDDWLDAGHGACLFRDPDLRKIVGDALAYFDSQRYELVSYVIMPNHVHVLLKLSPEFELPDILHSWKSFTAKAINKSLGRTGPLWQHEYWDRLIRNEGHFAACLAYIHDNPEKARLAKGSFTLCDRSVGVPPASASSSGRDARAPLSGAPADAGVDLDIFQCSGCGLVQLASEPVPYYREVIRAAGISRVLCEAKRRQFSDFIARHELSGKKVVEIGCGRGEFLSILAGLPVEAHGIEFSEEAVRCCRDAGLRVSRGYPDGASGEIPGAPFDAFFLLMFLEHMPDPCASLRAIRDQLVPGGIGLVEVPNFDMMVRECLFSEFISDHLMYFSRETLVSTLRWNGFDVIGAQELRDDYVLSVAVRKRGPLDLSEFARRQDEISGQLREFIAAFPAGRVAVWGAGHQALAVLALSGIAPSIRFVVDSAPFKQGKVTPATHLPVVPPEALKSDPVDAVIVMAASYSDEVAAIIAREHGGRVQVAILRENGLELPGGVR